MKLLLSLASALLAEVASWAAVLAVAALLVVAVDACGTWVQTGSAWRGKCTHVGARLHTDDPRDLATTVQVSTDWPACREVYR